MERTLKIFDGHAYTFPSLRDMGGFASADDLRRHLQQAMAAHHQPVLRARDRAQIDDSGLTDESNWPSLSALKETGFHAGSNGRFEWTVDGEEYIKQYFPPSITDMSYSPDQLVAEMDYAGVEKALLHRTPYLGIGNEYIADCVRRFPDRLMGLAHVEEWLVETQPERCIENLTRAVREQGLSGLHFLPPQMNLYDQRGSWDAEGFRPFWDAVADLNIPVFFSLKEREEPKLESYFEELKTLQRWMERYPDSKVVMTHGLQWRMFMDDDGINLPEQVWEPFRNPNLYLQLLFPIALGGIWDYPMSQARPAIEECVHRIGADRLMWGTDMPIVTRFWTYRQNKDFLQRYCDFLDSKQMEAIMGGTTARLLGVPWP